VILETLQMTAAEFEQGTGWALKPEGACRDGRCIPLAEGARDPFDVRELAERLNMPLVHDEAAGLWALGP